MMDGVIQYAIAARRRLMK